MIMAAVDSGLQLGLVFDSVVPRQLDHRHVQRGQHRSGIQVAAFLRLPIKHGPAALQLVDLAHLHQRPEHKVVQRVAFPSDARAMVAEESARPDPAKSEPISIAPA